MLKKSGYKAYIFFPVLCLLAVDWSVLSISETKRKTLRKMDEVIIDVQGQEEETIMHQARISVGQQTLYPYPQSRAQAWSNYLDSFPWLDEVVSGIWMGRDEKDAHLPLFPRLSQTFKWARRLIEHGMRLGMKDLYRGF